VEEEKKSPETRRSAPGTGEQYLLALIKCADWIERPYKQLSEKNRANTEALKELYLCACDGVPAEKAAEALKKNPPEGALRFLRRKHIENLALGNYSEELSGIKKTTSTLEHDVKMMSDMLTHIASHVPNFDAMFPERPPGEQEGKTQENAVEERQENRMQKEPERAGMGYASLTLRESREREQGTEQLDPKEEKERRKENIFESGLQKIREWGRAKRIKKEHIPEFMGGLLEKGYSTEQLDYFLDCMEEGMTLEDVQKFASPKLPVELMQRLRMLEERKKKDGK